MASGIEPAVAPVFADQAAKFLQRIRFLAPVFTPSYLLSLISLACLFGLHHPKFSVSEGKFVLLALLFSYVCFWSMAFVAGSNARSTPRARNRSRLAVVLGIASACTSMFLCESILEEEEMDADFQWVLVAGFVQCALLMGHLVAARLVFSDRPPVLAWFPARLHIQHLSIMTSALIIGMNLMTELHHGVWYEDRQQRSAVAHENLAKAQAELAWIGTIALPPMKAHGALQDSVSNYLGLAHFKAALEDCRSEIGSFHAVTAPKFDKATFSLTLLRSLWILAMLAWSLQLFFLCFPELGRPYMPEGVPET